MRTDKLQAVKIAAQQRGWDAIYSNYPGLSDAMQKGTRSQPCPLSSAGKTKFRFFKDASTTGGAYHNDVGAMPDGIEVLSWYLSMSKGDVLDELISILGGNDVVSKVKARPISDAPRQFCTPEAATKRENIIKRIWDESQPIQGTIVEQYLLRRGVFQHPDYRDQLIESLGNNLRFHPALSYKENDESPWQKLPGMLAIVRDKHGKPLTLHRTFLKPDGSGKADVERPKMVLAPPRDMRGGYIQLDKPIDISLNDYIGKFVGTAEGIENALSAREATGTPMWVGVSDRLMEMIEYPSDVRALVVYQDIEPSGAGARAAQNIKDKHESKDVLIAVPTTDKKKVDWNDEYVSKGHQAFNGYKMHPEYRIQGIDFDKMWEEL